MKIRPRRREQRIHRASHLHHDRCERDAVRVRPERRQQRRLHASTGFACRRDKQAPVPVVHAELGRRARFDGRFLPVRRFQREPSTSSGTLSYFGSNQQADLTGTTVASILDLGNALRINVGSATQTDTISGFGSSDSAGVIDFKNGAGGFASVDQVVAALHADGNGGTMLSLGHSGSIDFANTAASQLHASNFKVG